MARRLSEELQEAAAASQDVLCKVAASEWAHMEAERERELGAAAAAAETERRLDVECELRSLRAELERLREGGRDK
eukprot:6674776-Prymnesium_polylepis.1